MADYEDEEGAEIDEDEEEEEEGLPAYIEPPKDLKGLRCCIPCLLIKSYEDFLENGCENCPYLDMREEKTTILNATTAEFEGFVAMMDRSSWVARWQRIDQQSPGIYAIKVFQDVGGDVESIIEQAGARNLGRLTMEEQ